MAATNYLQRATNYLSRVLHEYVYVCGHKAVGNAGVLQDLYQKLLAYDLLPTKAQVRLLHHCPDCLKIAFQNGPEKGPEEQLGYMVTSPMASLATSKDLASMNISWLLFSRGLWSLLTDREMHKYWLNPHDEVVHDLFFAWRQWCLLSSRCLSSHSQVSFLKLIAELYGRHAAEDVANLVVLYRRQPRAVESMIPGDSHERDNIYRECARRFHEHDAAQDLKEAHAHPVDLAEEYSAVLRAASQWSASSSAPRKSPTWTRTSSPGTMANCNGAPRSMRAWSGSWQASTTKPCA